ncbi:hypothetical protein KAR91_59915 [Candidatus Pacearchaeota archaeon]|nr:hypothetical protein [Candidatus Pacearchaeota archaeon]
MTVDLSKAQAGDTVYLTRAPEHDILEEETMKYKVTVPIITSYIAVEEVSFDVEAKNEKEAKNKAFKQAEDHATGRAPHEFNDLELGDVQIKKIEQK